MALIPDDVVQQIPPLHSQDSLPDAQLYAYARLTLKEAGFTWYVLEMHIDQDLFSGYLFDPQAERFGYFSFAYMEEQLGPTAPIEYDPRFTPTHLVDAVVAEHRERHRYGERFPIDASLAPHRAYYYAAAYPRDATQVYRSIRDIVLKQDVNLSVFQIPPVTLPGWHIVVIGDRPSETIHEQIITALSGGTFTTIPYDLLIQLFARKLEQNAKGSWREGHTTITLKRKQKKPNKHKRDPRHRDKKGRN